jgi:hypothetical protein
MFPAQPSGSAGMNGNTNGLGGVVDDDEDDMDEEADEAELANTTAAMEAAAPPPARPAPQAVSTGTRRGKRKSDAINEDAAQSPTKAAKASPGRPRRRRG